MVTEIDDVGRGLARFKAKEVPVVYGPGRHPASTSVFLYFLDPDGMTLEYSFGMEQFPELEPRRTATSSSRRHSTSIPGARYRDPRMSAVGEIAQHTVRSEAR